MDYKHNPALLENARQLRKNMTPQERHLWYDFLRNHPLKFVRQKILGLYIADFYCAKAKLVIELDGSQHYEADEKAYDWYRTEYLKGYDLLVIRFPNNELNRNFSGVCEIINRVVQQQLQS